MAISEMEDSHEVIDKELLCERDGALSSVH